ncbi:VanW family protein [Patescibacteria group bacterium]|nr:VanW family protein [Patescibacteria group bacterium]
MSTVVRWMAFLLFAAAIMTIATFDIFSSGGRELIRDGVNIGPISVGGKTTAGAVSDLRQFLSGYRLTFSASQNTESVGPFIDTNQDIVRFHVETAVDTAYNIGRHSNTIIALIQRLGAGLFGTTVPVPYSLDEQALLNELTQRFGAMITPAEDARLQITVMPNGRYDISILPEKTGLNFDTNYLTNAARERLRNLSSFTIDLEVLVDAPKLTTEELTPLIDQADEILKRAPLNVRARSLAWTISRSQLADWIVPLPNDNNQGWSLALDHNRLAKHLESYTSSIAIEPKNAIFEIDEQGKVSRFEPSIEGEKLDVEMAIELLEKAFLEPIEVAETIDLPVTVAYPETTTEASNPYDIKEIIGMGATNFKGSPVNRRHNIANGAKTLNGLLIPPGQEFSLLSALGEINAESGYLEELVIKQNETKPEYGGGLCQIGTTAFRTVLDAGLPVTMRQNHSYRVSYYERDGDGNFIGPGKDATIYEPWPDFKFINDTPAHILFLTSVQGDRLQFIFWGVDDGRQAEQGEVSIWNVNDPPPKKEILTTNLAPGTWKCTEHPHPSASTVFTYTVTYPNNEVKEEKFYSYYRPWQEVCLVGATAEEIAAQEAAKILPEQTESESGISEAPPEG